MLIGLSLSEQLAYTTIRIETNIGSGTGFYFKFHESADKQTFTSVIITNKHVVRGAKQGRFVFNVIEENGKPVSDKTMTVTVDNFENKWFFHPDSNVDLCIFLLKDLVEQYFTQGYKFSVTPLDKTHIPSQEEFSKLALMEDVVMVGYPNSIWDHVNNKPVFRKGITSSHPSLDWQGKPDFLVDMACVKGSSGSPVFLYNVGMHQTKDGTTIFGNRLLLLGVLYSGPLQPVKGTVETFAGSNRFIHNIEIGIQINLGNVIRATKILDFEKFLKKSE